MRGVRTPSVGQSFSWCLRSSPVTSKHSFSPLHTLSTVRSDHHHHQKKATKYWNDFYKRHHNKFFKDRHYLEKDWAHYFSSVNPNSPNSSKVVLEVGCGAGNTVFPLLTAFPNVFVHACDFSSNAIALVKSHGDFREDRVKAFVCDVTNDDLCETIIPSSVDVVTLIFTLSAVSPKKMPLILQNIKKVLKPNGYVLLRDYATGDFAQEKLMQRNQMISENFYVRGDGTCAFYFSEDFLSSLFKQDGFDPVEINVYCKQIENRSRNIIMDRRWIRAVFCKLDHVQPQAIPITH
ncbi:Methyltransferase type 12 [Macleaya cordata]|uniref:tRNA N(3)-methylcytidine methyltransferase n=1 Tax=Macleaya cordata TaxID=56857 RepID=A0A200QDA1_MACCD|nr:Methyltransferase type 12 [Macleaya cordata]